MTKSANPWRERRDLRAAEKKDVDKTEATKEAKFLAEEDAIIELAFYLSEPAMCFRVQSRVSTDGSKSPDIPVLSRKVKKNMEASLRKCTPEERA